MQDDDSDDEGDGSWVQALASLVNCGVGTAFSSFDATESSRQMPPVPPPAEDDASSSIVDNLMRGCGGGEVGQTYDEVVASPQKHSDIPVEALYDEILSLRQQVARMEDGAPYALQDELDRLRRRLDTADGDIGCPPPPPEDSPLELEVGGRDSAATLSVADRESSAARLSRGGPRPAR